MRESQSNYLSYLLRIWQDSDNGEWHATLQDVFQEECHHYVSLPALYKKLEEVTRERSKENIENYFVSLNPLLSTRIKKE